MGKIRQVITKGLSILMLTAMIFQPVASFAVDSESLPSAEGKTQAQHSDSEPNTAPITVKLNGSGEIHFDKISDKTDEKTKNDLQEKVIRDDKEYTFRYPVGEKITIVTESEEDEIRVQNDSVDPKKELSKESKTKADGEKSVKMEQEITAADKGNKVEVTCKKASEKDAKKVNTQSSTKGVKAKTVKRNAATYASKASTTLPKKGASSSGTATCTSSKRGHPSTANFKINSGKYKDKVIKAHCVDKGVYLPGKGAKYSFHAKVSSITTNKNGDAVVKVTCSNMKNTKGHYTQNMSGYFTYTIPQDAYIQIAKKIANTDCTVGNSNYSVTGTVYKIYKTAKKTGYVGTLTIGSNGLSNKLKVKKGTYYAFESKPGKNLSTKDEKGIDRSKKPFKIVASAGKTVKKTYKDTAKLDPMFIQVEKKNKRPEDKKQYSLAGAIYQVSYYGSGSRSGKPIRSWKFKTDSGGYIQTQSRNIKKYLYSGTPYKDTNGNVGFPVGNYTVKEEHAPDGYAVDEKTYPVTVTGAAGNTDPVVSPNQKIITSDEYQPRGDVKFVKVGETSSQDENGEIKTSSNRLANVKFKLTYKGPKGDESHIIYTNDKGEWNSSASFAKHTNNTNEEGVGNGVWFGESEDGKADDSQGALPEGDYVLEELECEGNRGYSLIDPVKFTVTKDGATIDLGTLVDPEHNFKTELTDKETGEHLIYGEGPIELRDRVTYKDLKTDKEYELRGTLMDKTTGKKALDKDGNEVVSEPVKFTPSEPDGYVDVTFKFDGTGVVIGKQFVAYEDMYEEGVFFGAHHDINDQSQTVKFPEIKTKAAGTESGLKMISGVGKQTITDTVSYKGLIAGETFKSKVWLADENGKTIDGTTSEKEFTASAEDGSYTMNVTLPDASKYAGKNVIVYEELYKGGKLIASHKDKDDKDQTLQVVKLKTKAVNKESGLNIIGKTGEQTIVDTVDYNNVIPGTELTGRAWLVDENGNEIEDTMAETKFTPSESKGSYKIELKYNADDVEGNVTVFEELYLGENLIGEHKDLTDSEQTLYQPSIGTTATGKDTGSHIVNGTGEQTIVDEIEYKGLEKNVEHVAKTWLVDSNGNKLDVPEVETKFTPNAATGKVKVEITFDASKYAGTNVIVFEEVYLQGQIIAEHKDTDDDNQTVQVSKIQTSATGKTLRNNMIPSKGKQVIEDAVDYENLPAGEPVTIKTYVVDKATGKRVDGTETVKQYAPEKEELTEETDDELQNDASDDISEDTANPEPDAADKENNEKSQDVEIVRASGTFTTSVTVDGEKVKGKTLVIFEEIYNKDGKLVGEHRNLQDNLQTIVVPDIGTKATPENALKNMLSGKGVESVKDTIKYTNMIPDKYTVKTWLVDKKTGKKVSDVKVSSMNILDKSTKNEEEQNYDASSAKAGEFTVSGIKVDSSKLTGKKLVVFEEITVQEEGGSEHFVTEHKDINDEAQTISVDKPITPPGTGDQKSLLMYVITIIIGAAAGAAYYKTRKKKASSNK